MWTERVGQGEVGGCHPPGGTVVTARGRWGGCHPPGGTVVTARGRWVGVTLQVVPW